jgi:aspartate aminotransferase-like enzyme
MIEKDFAELTLFITGPTWIRPEIRAAAALPEFGHRDSENLKRFGPLFAHLREIARVGQERDVILFNGSGSTAMEAAVRSLVAADETVLNVSVGAFGDLFHKLAVLNGKKAVQLKFAPGRAMDLARMEQALVEHKPAVVTLTQNETSTGVLNDVEAACALARRHGALPVVDGVSLFGGADARIPESDPVMYVTSTQKSLAVHAGFGIAFVSAEALDKAAKVADRGYSSDIVTQVNTARKSQTLTTPNGGLANQLAVQLDYIVNVEGVAKRYARHEAMRDMVAQWAGRQPGFELLAPEGHRSPTLTALRTPAGLGTAGLKRIKEAMRERGYLFDTGYGKLNSDLEAQGERPVCRIGHMGDITPDMLAQYLDVLGQVLAQGL